VPAVSLGSFTTLPFIPTATSTTMKKLKIDEANARSRSMEVELKEKVVELNASVRAKEVELKRTTRS
jgi:hypothetical protein